MTTRRNGPLTPRMRRLWTVQQVDVTTPAATVGQSGQGSQTLGSAFTSNTSITLRNATVARTFIKGFAREATVATTPTEVELCLGIGIFQNTLDPGEFPSVGLGVGDYFVRDCRRVLEPQSATGTLLMQPEAAGPNIGGIYDIDGKSKRKIRREAEGPTIVAQKDVVTEFDITLFLSITILWLY